MRWEELDNVPHFLRIEGGGGYIRRGTESSVIYFQGVVMMGFKYVGLIDSGAA